MSEGNFVDAEGKLLCDEVGALSGTAYDRLLLIQNSTAELRPQEVFLQPNRKKQAFKSRKT